MKKLRGFTLIELLIVVAIIAILAAIAIPNFLEAQVRAKVSRARADMRSLGTGIESYYIDYNSYPAAALADNAPMTSLKRATFRFQNGSGIATMTTPIAYISSYFADPFADTAGQIFGYMDTGDAGIGLNPASLTALGAESQKCGVIGGWILTSYGPDTDETKTGSNSLSPVTSGLGGSIKVPSTVYNAVDAQPSVLLLTGLNADTVPTAYTYDPTNGTVSRGDVYRVKQ